MLPRTPVHAEPGRLHGLVGIPRGFGGQHAHLQTVEVLDAGLHGGEVQAPAGLAEGPDHRGEDHEGDDQDLATGLNAIQGVPSVGVNDAAIL